MSFYKGRRVDSFQKPHGNRSRYLVRFWFTPNQWAGEVIAVSDLNPLSDLQAYKKKVIAMNPGWHETVLDPLTKMKIKTVKLWKVTADRLGPDEEGVEFRPPANAAT